MSSTNPDTHKCSNELEGLLRIFESGLASLASVSGKDVRIQIRKRQDLAVRLGLGQRLMQIYDELKFVPEQRKPVLDGCGCVAKERTVRATDRTTIIPFELKGSSFVLTFREPPVSYEAVFSYLDLSTGAGELVFSAHYRLDVEDSGRDWRTLEVEAFVPGDWVKNVLELSTCLSAQDDPSRDETMAEGADELKKRFGL